LHIVPVRASNSQADRHTMPLCQQTTFDAVFAPICGVWPRLSPPQGGLWPVPHPYSPRPSQCPAVRQTAQHRPARAAQRRQRRPIEKSGRALWTWRTARSGAGPPTGSRSVGHRRWHRHSGDPAPGGGHPQSGACSAARAAAAPTRPRVQRLRFVVVLVLMPLSISVIRIGSNTTAAVSLMIP
jgi:hypothetical protein